MEVLKPFRFKVAADILKGYQNDMPFHLYFAALCKQNKHWGSKDRKIYKTLCFAYFRSGVLFKALPFEEAVQAAYALAQKPFSEQPFSDMYPMEHMVSEGFGFSNWCRVLHARKPMYLHLKKGVETRAIAWLEQHHIPFEVLSDNTLRLPSDSKCNDLIDAGTAWVMDMSSQMASDAIEVLKGESVWDACSGSGGKSLYLRNKYPFDFALTCSDVRFHTLENLKNRFYKAGFPLPSIELTDLNSAFQLSNTYHRIVLDVPCSGSGTWGRSPEQIAHFNAGKLAHYSSLQKTIFSNAIPHLKRDGTLYYLTCSVFAEENERNVAHFCQTHGLQCTGSRYYHAPDFDSDVLFCAVLKHQQ